MSNDEHDKRQWLHWLREAMDRQNGTAISADKQTENTDGDWTSNSAWKLKPPMENWNFSGWLSSQGWMGNICSNLSARKGNRFEVLEQCNGFYVKVKDYTYRRCCLNDILERGNCLSGRFVDILCTGKTNDFFVIGQCMKL